MRYSEATKLRSVILEASKSLSDQIASDAPYLFNAWESGTEYSVGDRIRYGTTLYKCVQAHTSQDNWTPDQTPALWARAYDPGEEWPEWVQPTGAQDAYMIGDKVSHNAQHWVSVTDNNVWEPGVYGWEVSA